MENLLFFHTDIDDIVFDPFAAEGITIDACKSMFRRYYCSDRKVKPDRENDIKTHDMTTGFPADLPKPKLIYLNPPIRSHNQDEDSNEQLDHISIVEFNELLTLIYKEIDRKKVEKIAILIPPVQNIANLEYTDLISPYNEILYGYEIEMRYVLLLPQYNDEQLVEDARKGIKAIVLHRDLVVWKRKPIDMKDAPKIKGKD